MWRSRMPSRIPARTKYINWPIRVPTSEDAFLLDQRNRTYVVDVGRFILYKGSLGAATVRPVFELWRSPPLSKAKPKPGLSLVEPAGLSSLVKPEVCSLSSENLLFMAAGLDRLVSYQVLKSYRERTRAASVPVYAPANLTTKQKLKKFLGTTRNVKVPAQVLSLEDFLTCLDLGRYLADLDGMPLLDLKTLSEQELAQRGIEMEHIVQLKNGINYLMDLHDKSFALAPPAV